MQVSLATAVMGMMEQSQTENTCENCGFGSSCTERCHSCANTVCKECMAEQEGCCFQCLEMFPVSPVSRVASPVSTVASPMAMPMGCFMAVVPPMPMCAHVNTARPVSPPPQVQPFLATCPSPQKAAQVQQAPFSELEVDALPRLGLLGFSRGGSTLPEPLAQKRQNRMYTPPPAQKKHEDSEMTTMMICNIPCRFGHDSIAEAITSVGFAGTYNLLHLPTRHGKSHANIGYAFVNFNSAQLAEHFAAAFHNFQFPGTQSSKKCIVKVAREQGYKALASLKFASTERDISA